MAFMVEGMEADMFEMSFANCPLSLEEQIKSCYG